MTSPDLGLILSKRAQRDFDNALLWSAQTWGVEQKDEYKRTIEQALRRLQTYPELGQSREDFGPGYRALTVQRHLIVYRIEPTRIRVLRIVHVRRDVPHLTDW